MIQKDVHKLIFFPPQISLATSSGRDRPTRVVRSKAAASMNRGGGGGVTPIPNRHSFEEEQRKTAPRRHKMHYEVLPNDILITNFPRFFSC